MKKALGLLLGLILLLTLSKPVMAKGDVLGIHILHPYEFETATALLSDADDQNWRYVTIPLGLDDLDKADEWQTFFDNCKEAKLIPLVRLTTRFENGAWKIPNKREITQLIGFLSRLDWPTDERNIIVLNEVNHSPEFGGSIAPADYVDTLRFASNWAHTEGKNYKVMGAAMDLAASNTGSTAEAFWYLDEMNKTDPDWLGYIDYWNSHSYPNPGFSAAPMNDGKQSLRGFQYELSWAKEKSGKDFQVFITETGWRDTRATNPWLKQYYAYALQHIWSDSRVKGVTPFLLQGAPGPFTAFSFLDASGKPTQQYLAFRSLIE